MAAGRLIFILAVSFLAGALGASFGWNFYLVGGLWTAIQVAAIFYRQASKLTALIALLVLLGGFGYYHFYVNWRTLRLNLPENSSVKWRGIIIAEPKQYESVQGLEVKLRMPFYGRVRIITGPEKLWRYGDLLELRGDIQPGQIAADPPVSFFPEIEFISANHGFWLKHRLLNFRNAILGIFHRHLPEDSAKLLGGLTLGARSEFDPGLREAMRASGTTHLVALSGYNISILVWALAAALGRWLSRRWTFTLTTAIIVLFVLMTGAEPSIVRAALMGFLVLLARERGRIYSMENAITLTALIMVVIDPTVLGYNLGFQLSFLSLLGIVYLAPALHNVLRLKAEPGFLSWRENLVNTIAAQLAVLPLLVQSFGGFSLTAFLANTLILGIVPITMFLGFIIGAIGFISAFLAGLFGWLANVVLNYQLAVIRFFAEISIPVSLPFDLSGSFLGVIIYYGMLLAFTFMFTVKSTAK